MIFHQLRLPICEHCGNMHTHFAGLAYSALCQPCHDRWIVETFATSPAVQRMTDAAALNFIRERRPELFDREVLPAYWVLLKNAPIQQKGTAK